MPDAPDHVRRLQPAAALATWILPGLGHVLIGQKQRGYVLMLTILCLWITGVLIGGITVIDRYDRGSDKRNWWFVGQALLSPSIIVDTLHQRLKNRMDDPFPAEDGEPRPFYEPSYGIPFEQGTLFTALAGLLNLLCIIDVAYCDPMARRVDDEEIRRKRGHVMT